MKSMVAMIISYFKRFFTESSVPISDLKSPFVNSRPKPLNFLPIHKKQTNKQNYKIKIDLKFLNP